MGCASDIKDWLLQLRTPPLCLLHHMLETGGHNSTDRVLEELDFQKWPCCVEARSEVENVLPPSALTSVFLEHSLLLCSSDSRGPVTGASFCFTKTKVRGHLFACLQARQRPCGPGAKSGHGFQIYASQLRQCDLGASQ